MTSFDRLTKDLAETGLTRRSSLKLAFAGAAAAAMSALGVGAAGAAGVSPAICGKGCTGVTGITPCKSCSNANCYCFKNGSKFSCGCNVYCSNTKTCTSSSSCGKGFFCATSTGCGSGGVCIHKCSSTCHLVGTNGGAGGATAA